MKKNNKLLICIALIVSILVFVLTYYFLYVHKETPEENIVKELSGEKLVDGLYEYSLDIGDYNHGINIYNNTIYYWKQLNNKYGFYRKNIYNNKEEKIGNFDNENYYCYFESNYIDCSSDDNKKMFNYDFKNIYDGEHKDIVPYKNNLLTIEKDTAYYKNKEYKKLDTDMANYNLYSHYTFDNNIYLLYYDYDNGKDCILNVEDGKCEEFEYGALKQYKDGFYYYDAKKIKTLNITTKEVKEYTNYTESEYLAITQFDNGLLYYFSDDYLKIYNLENGKISLFDYRINEEANNLILDNNLLYLVGDKKVYVFDLKEISTNEMTKEEIEVKLEKILSDRIEKINNDYKVDIKIRKDANIKLKIWNQSTKGETSYDKINDSLDYAEEVLSYFGPEFFKEFIHGEYTGLRIYIVKEIKEKSSFNMAGEAFRYYDKYAVFADTSDFKRTLCHELMHSLEDAVDAKNKKIFKKWDSYNPEGFKYKEEFDENASAYKYTANYGKGDVYFIDNYSQTNGLEDRGRIFENMCMNTTGVIKKNPLLLKKAEYQVSEIIKNYPMLDGSIIFESIK